MASALDPVLIVGGGIAGLSLGLALAGRGIASHILERRAEFSEAGAGIQLSPNGVRALEALGLKSEIAAVAGRPDAIHVHDGASGRVLQRLPLGDWIEARHGAPYLVAHRRDLQGVLLSAVERQPLIRITTGFEIASFEAVGKRVRVKSAAGATLEGPALIGADGVASVVRNQLHPSLQPRFSGQTAARAVLPSASLAGDLDTGVTGVWLAPDAHVVHYPVRNGAEIAVVVIRVEPWQPYSPTERPRPIGTRKVPGRHLVKRLPTDETGKQMHSAEDFSQSGNGGQQPGWSAPASRDDVLGALDGFAPRLVRALGQAHEWRRWALLEAEPLPGWSNGRVTLIGDAAHPVLPFLAQGGSLALEDAVTLAAAIAGRPDDLVTAFRDHAQARLPRASAIAAKARRNGRIYHVRQPAAAVRNLGLRLIPAQRLMASYDWIYGWRPDPSM